MPLNLYRRHRQGCEAGYPEESRSGEFDERKKGWKRCTCVIFASGTLGGKFARKATGTADWVEAHRIAEMYAKADSWTGKPPQPVVAVPLPSEPSRISIEDAIKLYLANREASVAHPTYRKYQTFTKQIQAFADSLGYVMLDQFRPADIDVFYTKSKLGPRSKAKMLDRLRGLFRFAVHRDWIPKSPVSPDLKPPAGSTKAANKMPFTDEQVDNILKACDRFEERPWANRFGSGVWTADDLKEFTWMLLYTGLRISDIVLFDIERLHGNEVFLRAKKNGGDVFTYIPDWFRDRLIARAKRYGRKPFLISKAKNLDSIIETWREQLDKVFEMADLGEERATPHRFRHTFARILLQNGVPVADVADLIGDDEKTVREHYARWVPERQARLTKILKDAFHEKPKLAAIRGGRA
jgi:integrase